jgi:DNA-binding NarL/FixJ family response regulator
VVVGGEEATRLLLRGLLRLHHFRIEGEAEGETHALELIRERHPSHVIIDVDLAEGSVYSLVGEARAACPNVRIVLLASASRRVTEPSNPQQRPDYVLFRPFRILQFAEALGPRWAAKGS